MIAPRVLVCGGRDYRTKNNKRRVFEELDAVYSEFSFYLVEGGASGADELAREWAQARQVPVITHYANWAKLGRKAGPIRNRQMLTQWTPVLVLAFPGGHGTKNMIDLARLEKTEVRTVGWTYNPSSPYEGGKQ